MYFGTQGMLIVNKHVLKNKANWDVFVHMINKKSPCAGHAEANSERNLYNPPSGLVQSPHIL